MDISDTTAEAQDVSDNKVFYNSRGIRTVGTGGAGGPGYLPLTGGEMSGTIAAKMDWSSTSTPSSTRTFEIIKSKDSADGTLSIFKTTQNTSKTLSTEIGTSWTQIEGGSATAYRNTAIFNIAYDGTPSVTLSSPPAWRTALELGTMATQSSDDYLAKIGGTITGQVIRTVSGWDNATAPSADRNVDTRYISDASNKTIVVERLWHRTTDAQGVEYGVRRQLNTENTNTKWNTIRLEVDTNGVNTVSVTSPTAWREALGLGTMATQASTSYLGIGGGMLKGSATWTQIGFESGDSTRTAHGAIYASHTDDYTRIGFTENYKGSTYSEDYLLPVPEAHSDERKWYSILTSKVTGKYTTILGTTTSVANRAWTQIASITLTAGTYILHAHGAFATDSTGYRAIAVNTTANTTMMDRFSCARHAPANGDYTELNFTKIQPVSETTTYYLNAYQTSGSSMDVSGGLRAMRII